LPAGAEETFLMDQYDQNTAAQLALMGGGSFINSEGQQTNVSGLNQNQLLHQVIALLVEIRDLLKIRE
jgi:hypothetical protein